MDYGHAFTTTEIGQRSDLDVKLGEDDLFQIPVLQQDHIDSWKDQHVNLFELDFRSTGTPERNASPVVELSALGQDEDHGLGPQDAPPGTTSDIWDLDVLDNLVSQFSPKLRSWEAFEKLAVTGAHRIAYLSESSPEVFDAALAWHHNTTCDGVLSRDVFLDALRNLALGRSSIHFQWQASEQVFVRTLDKAPTAGLSLSVTDSATSNIVDYGTLLRRLQDLTTSPRAQTSCAVAQALLNASARVLGALEAHVISRIHCQSILQLQEALRRPHQVLELLQQLVDIVSAAVNDEEIISRLADAATVVNETGSFSALLCNRLLEEASRPWLVHMAEELGLAEPLVRPTTNTPRSSEQLDISEPTVAQDSIAGWVLDREHERLVFATRETVKILRAHFPGTRLDTVQATNSTYSTDVKAQLVPVPPSDSALRDVVMTTEEETNAWSHDDVQHQFLQAIDLRMSTEPETHDCMLRQHLNVQHAFQLLGSGEFITRLSTALFSAETQSAERRRGMVPTAQTMGLRLDARDEKRWPPASSELRLTLLGVLTDTYHQGIRSHSTNERRKDEIPGGLSFAIRELPDEEIDKVMDASSLYALDFLKLQYTPPSPLDAIITPTSLQRYDDVFRSLLRMLRVQYVVVHLRSTCNKTDLTGLRFAHAAQHVVAALMAHFMDVGIAIPWTDLQHTLDAVEQVLASSDVGHIPSIHELRDMHNEGLESIRSRLFLRRKQITIRAAVDNVLIAVLKPAAAAVNDAKRSDVYEGFYGSVRHLIKLLQELVDKPTRSRSRDTDVEVVKLLLQKLDFNGYFNPTSTVSNL
ncbi:hypothetical protein LTR78_008514 [Recurvomyces mirabilis]|uniref:Spindle pole body component n=1 Tax=Recurvomyces mirabilis TaxID=574656 RepID=A0AAE0TR65_9PEZI|nr:hypothetical protein LTR78_008514 [Recurvomyces mirabilis]KAK5156265.1 hypothetical protein LTS14_005153 [Recurvomyces mirabilis]